MSLSAFRKKGYLCLGLGMLVVLSGLPAPCEDGVAGSREEILLERIEQLERRVVELESRLGAAPENAETPAEKRITSENSVSPPKKTGVIPAWDNGFVLSSEEGLFELRVGGRLHLDYGFVDHSGNLGEVSGPIHDTGEFRRARINISGKAYETLRYRMEFDFAEDGTGKFKDVWTQMTDIPYVGALKAGHFREPVGLDEQTSSNHITFIERNQATALAPGRNLGLMLENGVLDGRLNWALGLFRETDSFPGRDDAEDGYAMTGRVIFLPWYRNEGRHLLHLAGSYSRRYSGEAGTSYSSRSEINIAPAYLDTEMQTGRRLRDARSRREDLFNLEAAWVYGPLSVQTEYIYDRVDTRYGNAPSFCGYYIEASYFLTGENRNYRLSGGTFSRIQPKQNFRLKGGDGWGAWQLAVRRSRLDLNSGSIRGGEGDNWTIGLNWYLNPNTRLMLNYVHADIDHDLYSGTVNAVQSRIQFDF